MRYSTARIGRIFVIRLEDNDLLPGCLESFAWKHRVLRGLCILVGGIRSGGRLVVGPEEENALPVEPMLHHLSGVHEITGAGTLFPDEKGRPRLHMHASLGRAGTTRSGCVRPGIRIWKVGEVILLEIRGNGAVRRKDAPTGFHLLDPGESLPEGNPG